MQTLSDAVDDWVEILSCSELVKTSLGWMNKRVLPILGIQSGEELISPRNFVYMAICTYATILLCTKWIRSRKRCHQKQELEETRAKLNQLQEKVMQMESDTSVIQSEIRIFMDGAFDLMHYGHMNAFRLGRSLGTHLVVGVNSDESITECKGGAPLMNDQERLTMVSSCKFVDEVVPGCPYIMTADYLKYVIDKYKIDLVVHGDDPCIVDGKDVYASAKAAGKYRSIPRTEGVSTTDIVGRMLAMTQGEQHNRSSSKSNNTNDNSISFMGQKSKFLTTSRILKLFSANVQAPTTGMKVVYIDGAWDMFHPGHVALLRAAKERGDYLIVGVFGDALVHSIYGLDFPLLNLNERVLSVLGCRYVDDAVIDAPYEISKEMLAFLKISEVIESPLLECRSSINTLVVDRYRSVPTNARHRIENCSTLFKLDDTLDRIHRSRDQFQTRFERKMNADRQFFEKKYSS